MCERSEWHHFMTCRPSQWHRHLTVPLTYLSVKLLAGHRPDIQKTATWMPFWGIHLVISIVFWRFILSIYNGNQRMKTWRILCLHQCWQRGVQRCLHCHQFPHQGNILETCFKIIKGETKHLHPQNGAEAAPAKKPAVSRTKSSNSHHLSISFEETVLVPASADSAAHAKAHIPFCRSVTCQVCSQHLRQWSDFHLIFFQKHVSDPSEKNWIGILAGKTHQKATFSVLPSCSVFQTA